MQMQPHGHVCGRSLSQLLSKRPPISQIKQIHAQIIARSLALSRCSLIDSLIHCYLHSKNLKIARALFDYYPLPSPPTLLWNLMIRAYSKLQHCSEPISLFRQMLTARAVPDEYTFTFVITSCAHQESAVHGQTVHGMVIKNGSLLNLYVANSVISMYGVFGRVDDAYIMFDEMSKRDVFSWTSLVSAYSKNGNMQRAGKKLIYIEEVKCSHLWENWHWAKRGDAWCEDKCNDYGALGICHWDIAEYFLAGDCECWK
ncbi:putative pentatricopeptide repeat-containing protein [Sesamum alatum]|uniref:Pentatricopeptide repeat-containing protein n=1 Tax=Sesamum alatum TaxID=300844 RepID=A0AAE1YVU2_9LAMI|nr:putative pentatricopeptide repeat-containing protein [Sesamum alatum]